MRSDQDIVDQTNAIARIIYAAQGYVMPEGFEFHTETINRHPHEEACWLAACQIQELMTSTDPTDAVSNIEDE